MTSQCPRYKEHMVARYKEHMVASMPNGPVMHSAILENAMSSPKKPTGVC